MKYSATDRVEEADFLNKLFYPALNAEGDVVTVPGPKIGRLVGKTFWHLGRLRAVKARRWLKGLSTGLLLDVAHVPILSTLFRRLLDLLRDVEEWVDVTQPRWDLEIRSETPYAISDCCWEFLARRYGLTVPELLEMDAEASRAQLGRPLEHPGSLITVHKDTA